MFNIAPPTPSTAAPTVPLRPESGTVEDASAASPSIRPVEVQLNLCLYSWLPHDNECIYSASASFRAFVRGTLNTWRAAEDLLQAAHGRLQEKLVKRRNCIVRAGDILASLRNEDDSRFVFNHELKSVLGRVWHAAGFQVELKKSRWDTLLTKAWLTAEAALLPPALLALAPMGHRTAITVWQNSLFTSLARATHRNKGS